jgi:predicted transcriptional regulator
MKYLSVFFLLLLVAAAPQKHDFHASLADIQYNPRSKKLEVTLRVFTDDLENDLAKMYPGKTFVMDFSAQDKALDTEIKRYLEKHFFIVGADKSLLDFVGREHDAEGTTLYFEMTMPKATEGQKMQMQNSIMLDLFDDQSNIVNIQWQDKKKTFLFVRSNRRQDWPW